MGGELAGDSSERSGCPAVSPDRDVAAAPNLAREEMVARCRAGVEEAVAEAGKRPRWGERQVAFLSVWLHQEGGGLLHDDDATCMKQISTRKPESSMMPH